MPSKLVWTSDPVEARRLRETGKFEDPADLEPGNQSIRVVLDRKRRAGKTVTVVSGFSHTAATLAELAAKLKKACGSGGTARESEIELQGDHETKVRHVLASLGYRVR